MLDALVRLSTLEALKGVLTNGAPTVRRGPGRPAGAPRGPGRGRRPSADTEAATGTLSAGSAAIAAGQEKSQTCQACHGATGVAGSPQWPNLAGQHHSYLVEAMKQYQRSERTDIVMGPLMGQLDEEAIEQIAAFYASQPGLFQTPR